MQLARKTRWRHWQAALGWPTVALLACGSGVAGERTAVREKVQFSTPGEPVDSPTARLKDDPVSKPFEFLDRHNSISGVVAPLVAPAPNPVLNHPRNARLLEASDRKKNWIYARPADLNRAQATEEMLGIRDSGGADQKPKSALESYIEGRGKVPLRERSRERPGAWSKTDAKKDSGPRS